ncbi:MAG: protein kinase [Rhodoferax sp.]|nr:protein kinase [Rhodoferax sp.]
MTATPATTKLCPGCFANKGLLSTCPHCGYDESFKRGTLVLPHHTLLHHGQYLIGKVLGKPGGFGITYLAFDTKLETKVAIKEYLPRDLAGRDGDHATIRAHSADDAEHFRYGLTQFLQEARTLARFDHANIVRVRNFFEENGTGYLVMDYYDGMTLADYLGQQPQGKLPEQTAINILMPILDGLREVHAKNFLHRDIKPQNVYLTTGNRAILLDFGAARQAMSERSRSLSVVLSEGYAPYEQYHRRGEQGPWTDIYACAAVLYHAFAGEPPPPATERMTKDELSIGALGITATLANALRLGLAVNHKNRPQTMAAFQALLLERTASVQPLNAQTRSAPNVPPVPVTKLPQVKTPTQRKKTSARTRIFTLLALVLVMIAVWKILQTRENPQALFSEGLTAYQNNDYAGALTKWRPLADKGLAEAQFRIGEMFEVGKGVQQNDAEAATWFRKAAEQGHATAQNNLGSMYTNGRGVPKNDAEAASWFHKAAELGYVSAQFNLGLMYTKGQGVQRNDAEAANWFRKAAEQGLASAQNNLGLMYTNGLGLPKNYAEAANWYHKAAEQGHARAQSDLGTMYEAGQGVQKNETEAVNWYRKAAEQGNALAQYNLGVMYAQGKGVGKNEAAAVSWFRKAAEQGDAQAQFHLGLMYRLGQGVQQSETDTANWFRKAAEQGHARAQYNLGVTYDHGLGVQKNEADAVYWYHKAAEQGISSAQYSLGGMYLMGLGVSKDDVEAVSWYRKAAEQDHADAQYMIGLMYRAGLGVPENQFQSVTWFRKAAALGHFKSRAELQKLGVQ